MVDKVLVDSSFLIALNNPRDKNHERTRQFAEDDNRLRLIPDVVLTEVAYMVKAQFGVPGVARFLNALNAQLVRLEPVTIGDVNRARSIMLMYADAQLDFVDCCIIALAERLKVTHICSFDYHDFTMIRPAHINYFHLLP